MEHVQRMPFWISRTNMVVAAVAVDVYLKCRG